MSIETRESVIQSLNAKAAMSIDLYEPTDSERHAMDVENATAAERKAETCPIHEKSEWWCRAASAWRVVETTCRKETQEREAAHHYCRIESEKWAAVEKIAALVERDDTDFRTQVYECLGDWE